jgi:hypothetical protein
LEIEKLLEERRNEVPTDMFLLSLDCFRLDAAYARAVEALEVSTIS